VLLLLFQMHYRVAAFTFPEFPCVLKQVGIRARGTIVAATVLVAVVGPTHPCVLLSDTPRHFGIPFTMCDASGLEMSMADWLASRNTFAAEDIERCRCHSRCDTRMSRAARCGLDRTRWAVGQLYRQS
jgi:hypothetical protein